MQKIEKAKILIKTTNYITGFGLMELLRRELCEQADASMAHSLDELKNRMEKERFNMLIIELNVIKRPVFKYRFRELLKSHQPTKTLVICNEIDNEFCHWLYDIGVLGVVNLNVKLAVMQKAISNVYKGKKYIDNEILLQLMQLPAEG